MEKIKKSDHFYLIDGSGYIFRAYYALPPLTRKSDGLPVGAVSGFCNMLFKLLEDSKSNDNLEKPTHFAVIFDSARKNFRNEIYSEYKGNRSDAPDDLIPQFEYIRKSVEAFNLPSIELINYEADDLIATYVEKILDFGANVECSSENLVQFAIMGDMFSRSVLGLKNPKIGLLNVGSEQIKGNAIVKKTFDDLKKMNSKINFFGFVEGNDINKGVVDVIVTDGFSGNIALKTAEGVAELIFTFLKNAYASSLISKLGYLLSKPAINRFKTRIDPRKYNGAVLLGLNGIVVKSHGGTDAFGFSNAIGVAVSLIENSYIDGIKKKIEN